MIKYLTGHNTDNDKELQAKCEKLEQENKRLKGIVEALQSQVSRARSDSKRFDTSIYL